MSKDDEQPDLLLEAKITFKVPESIPTDDLVNEFDIEQLVEEALEEAFPKLEYEPQLGMEFYRPDDRPSKLKVKFHCFVDRDTLPKSALMQSSITRSRTIPYAPFLVRTGRFYPDTEEPILWECRKVTISKLSKEEYNQFWSRIME